MNLLRGWLAPRVGPAGRCPDVRWPRPEVVTVHLDSGGTLRVPAEQLGADRNEIWRAATKVAGTTGGTVVLT